MPPIGRAGSQNPIPTFDGPIPPAEDFEYDRVVFMATKDFRPLLVYQSHIYWLVDIPLIIQ